MRLVVFCEAAADFRTAATLVDRVLREEGPKWVADLLETHPEAVRVFAGESLERPFYDVHHMQQHRRDLEKRLRETPLADLKSRGATTGLSDFLNELARELLPLCGASPC